MRLMMRIKRGVDDRHTWLFSALPASGLLERKFVMPRLTESKKKKAKASQAVVARLGKSLILMYKKSVGARPSAEGGTNGSGKR